MSLFDVIKYPVSCPPTYAELYALPKVAYYSWVARLFTSQMSMTTIQSTLHDLWHRGNYPSAMEDVKSAVESLRHELEILQ